MSPTSAAARFLEIAGREGPGLRVAFIWDEDRYRQEISLLQGPLATVCLTSELGREGDPWPASPPLQQLSLEEFEPGRPSALLLGMAGRSHWSQTVTADAATASLSFDVACRVQRQPDWLGSTYRPAGRAQDVAWVSRPAAPDSHEPGCGLSWSPGQRLSCQVENSWTLELATGPAERSPGCRAETVAGCVVIAPDLPSVRPPLTVRWRYRIAVLTAVAPPG